MRRKLYIETTVVSYLVARPSKNKVVAGHQESTLTFWSRRAEFDGYVSDLVRREASRGNKEQAKARLEILSALGMLEADNEAKRLAAKLLKGLAIPSEYPDDALHIAIATVNGMDFIVTWNFKHINNPMMRSKIRTVVESAGFVAPEICSPEELAEGEL